MGRQAALVSVDRRMRGRVVVDMLKKKMLLGPAWRRSLQQTHKQLEKGTLNTIEKADEKTQAGRVS
jgi:hypothetical protein